MRNKNGWLAMKWVWNRGRADLNPNRAVAAAASLPSSLTSINDLCIAFEKLKDSVYCEATLESKKSVKSDGPSLKIMKIFMNFCSSRERRIHKLRKTNKNWSKIQILSNYYKHVSNVFDISLIWTFRIFVVVFSLGSPTWKNQYKYSTF